MRILFVCLGNICRSPTAEGVFRALAEREGALRQGWVRGIDSAGTGDWHVGSPPDRRTIAAARQRGYDLGALRARQVTAQDFHDFDLLLAMDRQNLAALQRLRPADGMAEVKLFLEYAEQGVVDEVPDPYYGGAEGFDEVLDLCEAASRGLLASLRDGAVFRIQPAPNPEASPLDVKGVEVAVRSPDWVDVVRAGRERST